MGTIRRYYRLYTVEGDNSKRELVKGGRVERRKLGVRERERECGRLKVPARIHHVQKANANLGDNFFIESIMATPFGRGLDRLLFLWLMASSNSHPP